MALAVLLLLGCAKPYVLSESAPPVSDVDRVLLLPLNFDYPPPNSWVDGLSVMQDAMAAHLTAADVEVDRLALRDTLKAWSAAVRSVGGLEGADGQVSDERHAAARRMLARALLDESGADLLVAPTILIRGAEADGRKLRWDRRTADVEMRFGQRYGGGPVTSSGSMRALSLRVTLLDPQGQVVFERIQGLEPLDELYIDGKQAQILERWDLFEDEWLNEDTVRTAFEPYLETSGR